jgi:hypothetical protein
MNGPGPGNQRGHFEDFDVWQLHEEMLAAVGHTPFSAGDDFVMPLGGGFAARAVALVAARAGERPWGWKDPRTCLFLDFWEPLLPAASYLVLYRHPVDVVLSLLRRNTEPELSADPRLGFEAWTVHNRRLLDWSTRHRSRCFVAQTPAIAADFEGWVGRLADRFDLPLQASGAAAVLAPTELAASVREEERPRWERVIPEALDLYRQLEAIADLPGAAPRPAADPGTRLDVGDPRAPTELRLSEWLLFDLLQAQALRRQQRAAAEAFAAALDEQRAAAADLAAALEGERRAAAPLRQELIREQERAAALQRERDEVAARRDELAATLAAIERSRSFRLLAAWWRLARR